MDRIIEEFIELTGISSPSKNERAMADALKRKLAELGCEVREDDAAGKIPGTPSYVRLLNYDTFLTTQFPSKK